MAERASALASGYRAGRFGEITSTGPGIALAERRGLSLVQVAALGPSDDAVRTGIAATAGIAPSPEPNRGATGGASTVLWLGPSRWLVVEEGRAGRDLDAELRRALAATEAAVADVGHGRTVLRLSGRRASDVLAKGVSLDLHPRAFPVGACAQSLLGHVGVLLHHAGEGPVFDLYLARSYGLTAWEWLTEAAAEFGYVVSG